MNKCTSLGLTPIANVNKCFNAVIDSQRQTKQMLREPLLKYIVRPMRKTKDKRNTTARMGKQTSYPICKNPTIQIINWQRSIPLKELRSPPRNYLNGKTHPFREYR